MLLKIRILSIVFLLLFAALSIRLFYWQVIKRASLSDEAKNQYNSSQIIAAPRGNILASDKSFWVVRTQAWLIWANPRQIELTPREISNKLSPFFVSDPGDAGSLLAESQRLETILGRGDVSWIALKQKVNDEVKRNIEALNIGGIGFDAQESSYYPEASSAAQILGFVGKDEKGSDIGYFGIEGYYDLPLSGKPGFVGGQKDAFGSPILLGGTKEVNAVSGVDLETSIDKRIQVAVEKGLAAGIGKYGALGGSVTVMDPADGSIMAMASFPSFDPAKYSGYSNSLFKNPVISDSFEPG